MGTIQTRDRQLTRQPPVDVAPPPSPGHGDIMFHTCQATTATHWFPGCGPQGLRMAGEEEGGKKPSTERHVEREYRRYGKKKFRLLPVSRASTVGSPGRDRRAETERNKVVGYVRVVLPGRV